MNHREYVGPLKNWDKVAAGAFCLLAGLGLRGHHKLLDIGCGSMRIGRLLIPYLDKGCYYGVEPEKKMLEAGVKHELGMELKRARGAHFNSSARAFATVHSKLKLDFALANSIFTHAGPDIIAEWLQVCSHHLKANALLVASFRQGRRDLGTKPWSYPGTITYRFETMAEMAREHGLHCLMLPIKHPEPTQAWIIFINPLFDRRRLERVGL